HRAHRALHPFPTRRSSDLWDRFTLLFEDGGRLALRDKRRLGRAVLDPDLGGVGADVAKISRDAFRECVGRGGAPIKARIMDQSVDRKSTRLNSSHVSISYA